MKRIRLAHFRHPHDPARSLRCEKRDPVDDEANAIAPAPVTNDTAGPAAGAPPPVSDTADPSGDHSGRDPGPLGPDPGRLRTGAERQ